jgi:hypothetical protein
LSFDIKCPMACATQKEVRGGSARQHRRNTEASSPAGDDDGLEVRGSEEGAWLVSTAAWGGAASARRRYLRVWL